MLGVKESHHTQVHLLSSHPHSFHPSNAVKMGNADQVLMKEYKNLSKEPWTHIEVRSLL